MAYAHLCQVIDEDKKVIDGREKIREVKRNFFATIFNELLTGKKI